MPILSDPRHERFAQNLASGMGQVESYEAAGYKRSAQGASTLAKKPEVARRVAELLQPAADAIQAGVFDAVTALRDAAQAGLTAARTAAAEGDYRGLVGGAVEALKLAEVLTGGVSDRTETKTTDTLDEIQSRFDRLAPKGGAGSDIQRPH